MCTKKTWLTFDSSSDRQPQRTLSPNFLWNALQNCIKIDYFFFLQKIHTCFTYMYANWNKNQQPVNLFWLFIYFFLVFRLLLQKTRYKCIYLTLAQMLMHRIFYRRSWSGTMLCFYVDVYSFEIVWWVVAIFQVHFSTTTRSFRVYLNNDGKSKIQIFAANLA